MENIAYDPQLDTVPSTTGSSLKESSDTDVTVPMPNVMGESVLSFHDVYYNVKIRKGCCGCRGVEDKGILKNLSGIFKGGMNAIMGPTGSGKTTLLDILADRKNPNGFRGTILFNGRPQPNNFKLLSGYVVQDDVIMGTLTVRENLEFSAALRLPNTISKQERKKRVSNVLTELGLNKCADRKVGTEFIRGVSGGERKRTNIGMELIISPKVLFLDEPTTGLDANTANTVMTLLARLSKSGRTIIFSIHQPRYTVFRLFDTLMLLGNGETVYFGPSSKTVSFFADLGYKCQENNNPPDFFLDVVNGDPLATTENITELDNLERKDGDLVVAQLVEGFRKSDWSQMLENELRDYQKFTDNMATDMNKPLTYASGFFRQLGNLSLRTVKNVWRNPQTSVLQFVVLLIFSLVIGTIYWDMGDDYQSGIQNRQGVAFLIVMNLVFGNMSATELFIKDRAIFIHENANGFYRVSVFFMSKIFCDIIPLRFLPLLFFAPITYFMAGFQLVVAKFFIYFLTVFCVSISSTAVALAISASVKIFSVGNLFLALTYVFMMIFSSMLVSLNSIPVFLRWLKYFSLFRYGLTAIAINEFDGLVLCRKGNCTIEYSKEVLRDVFGVESTGTWDLYQNHVALLSMTFILLTVCLVQLHFIKKYK